MIKNIFYTILIFFSITEIAISQEPIFSQFYLNPVYMNPALAGWENNYRLHLNQRYQWPKIPSQFNTSSFSFDSFQNYTNTSFLISGMRNYEGEGFLTTNCFSVGGSYRLFDIYPSRIKFQAGFQYQNTSKRIDWSRLIFMDDLDPVYGDVYNSSFVPPDLYKYNFHNFSLGGVLQYRVKRGMRYRKKTFPFSFDAELGFAIHNILDRGDGFINSNTLLPKKYTVHGMFKWELSKSKSSQYFSHSFFYQKQRQMSTLQIGIFESEIYPVHVGLFYRNQLSSLSTDVNRNESMCFQFGVTSVFSNIIASFSLSKDFTMSKLNNSTNGTTEIVIILQSINGGLFSSLITEKRKKKQKKRTLGCYELGNKNSWITTGMGPLNPNPDFKTPWLKNK